MSVSLERLLATLRSSSVAQEDQVEQILNRLTDKGQRPGAGLLVQQLQRAELISSYQANCLCTGRSIVFGDYTILDQLAEIPIGHAFKVKCARYEKLICLVIVGADHCFSDKVSLLMEKYVEPAASLTHANLANIYEVGVRCGQCYLATELCEGTSLKEYARKHAPIDAKEALAITSEVAKGLVYAHECGVVHGGVNPQNIIQISDSDLKLTNFGVTRFLIEQDVKRSESEIGGERLASFDYISPEQAKRPQALETRADVYGLGCTLFYLLVGKPPYGGKTALEKIQAHRNDVIKSLSETRDSVPEEVEQLVRRMTAKNPRNRIASMRAVVAAIQELLGEETKEDFDQLASLPNSRRAKAELGYSNSRIWSSRKFMAGVSAVAVGLFVAIGLAWYGNNALESISFSKSASTKVDSDVHNPREGDGTVSLPSPNNVSGVDDETEIPGLTTDRFGPLSILSFVIKKKAQATSNGEQSSVHVGIIRRLESGTVINEHENVSTARSEINRLSTFLSQGEQVQIKQIDLSFTNIVDEELETLSELDELRELSLYSCVNVTDAGIIHLSQLRNLQVIDLRGTNVTADVVKQLPNGPLQTMMVDAFQGPMNGSILPELATRYDDSLSTLLLPGVPLNEDDFRWLEALRNLRELDVASTGVTSEWLQYIENLETLESLNLAGNRGIDAASLPYLSKMNRLTQLNLRGTSVNSREAFEQMLACQIVWD